MQQHQRAASFAKCLQKSLGFVAIGDPDKHGPFCNFESTPTERFHFLAEDLGFCSAP
jgi:hypothetical protein